MRKRWIGGAFLRLCGLVALVAVSAWPAFGQVTDLGKNAAVRPVELAGTHMLPIHSQVTGQDYVLYVNLPQGYEKGSGSYPVIYVADGQWDFILVQAIYGQQYYDGFIPGAIIVGVTWGGEKVDYDQRRAFDLTPTPSGQPQRYGNAPKFLEFIEKEAMPFVEARYRTSKDERTLTGSSFAGLFTLYALFNRPALFNHYVLTSPSWGWDNRVLLKDAERFAKSPLPRPVKVFMGIGEYEDTAGLETFATAVRGLKVAGLDLQTKVVAGAGHGGAKAEGFTRGLQFVFAQPCVSVPAEALQRLVGEYTVGTPPAGMKPAVVRIAAENGGLVAYPPGAPMKIGLCADGDLDFHIVGQFLKVHFVQEPDKTISGFRLQQYGGETVAKRQK